MTANDCHMVLECEKRPLTDTHRVARAQARTNSNRRSNCFARTGGGNVAAAPADTTEGDS